MKTSLLKSTLFLLLCSVLSFSLSSCKKDKDVQKPRTELLVGNWMLTSDAYNPAYDVDQDGDKETEIFPLYSACSKDDFITFRTGGTGDFDQGPLLCTGQPDQRTPFRWSLYNSDYTLVLAGESYALLELSETTMKIAYTFEEDDVTYTNTYTFTKKP